MRKTAARGVLAGVLAVGLVAGGATAAGAISRAKCGTNYLQVLSSQTTCWANAGTASVALYGVVGLSSGDNAGYLQGPGDFKVSFGKWASSGWLGTRTITVVHIR